ncbi:MAG: aminotransferase class V-fold PLP-dependent enzyme [Dehalococcoidia bacterium]|nr:aminotransferase class V-fold PLP-dependent enzyme [Dehalococcoidia bacterium]
MALNMDANEGGLFYRRLGIKRVINASVWATGLGGSISSPAVLKAVDDASRWFVDMDELNRKAGEVIARHTGAEAGLVTAGAAAGMLLEAAACMAGSDPAKVHRLPDTTGMKNEIVIQWAHRVNYEHSFRAAGAKLVQIGNINGAEHWQLEDAITENTAAVAHIFARSQHRALPFPKVVEIAHRRGVPVIVDASGMLPPPENLRRYIEMGADMVAFSGGKGLRGLQSTGILCGRRNLIEAAYANSSPNSDAIGRAAKVSKEEIAGLITALELFVQTDHRAVLASWRDRCQYIVAALQDIPGLRAEVAEATPELEEFYSTSPRALVSFEKSWRGPTLEEVSTQLRDGDPSIRVASKEVPGTIVIFVATLQDGEEEMVAGRLRQILTTHSGHSR